MRKLDSQKLIQNLSLGFLFIIFSTMFFLDITNWKALCTTGILTILFCVMLSFER